MKQTLVRLGMAVMVVSALVGCGGGGGGGGSTAASSTSTVPVTPTGVTALGGLTPTDFGNLEIAGSVQSVTIASPPVVTFQLLDAGNGNKAIEGFDTWTSQSATGLAASYPNIAFSIAKLVPGTNGSPAKWVSYIVTTMPTTTTASAPTRPSTDNTGTLTYLGSGQYKYTFYRDIKAIAAQVAAAAETATNKNADLGDLSYDPTLIHRVVIQVSGAMRGTGTNTATGANSGIAAENIRTPVDIIYDWIPATGEVITPATTSVTQREIVNVAACASCHNKFTFHGGSALTGKGGSRQETRICVVCHTDQRKYGRGEPTTTATGYSGTVYRIPGLETNSRAALDLPIFIHKIHMGEELTKTGSNLSGVLANETKYPQLIKNCSKCHSGDTTKPDGTANTITTQDGTIVQMATAQGNNWKNKPNRAACGACHDGINFNTGLGTTLAGATTGHGAGGVGGAQANDSACSTCHTPTAIMTAHTAVTTQNRNSSMFSDCLSFGATCNGNSNAAWLASNFNNLPAGAIKVTYDIKSVSRNSSMKPVIVFRILQNGARVDFNAKPAGGTSDAALSNLELWNNFMGAPSVYFVWGVPQDGITKPGDFNASASSYLRNIWNGKASGTGAGTMTGPDADGYYTVTLTGVTVVDGATMLTGGLGYSYAPATTMPLTQTNLTADYPVTAATANGAGGSVTLTAYMPNKTGGLIVIAPDAQTVATAGAANGGTGGAYTPRRAIVADARCNNCHQELGAFNAESFHAGQRNDGTTCSWCHNPNRTSSGWSADSTNFIHGIHGALKRKKNFTWHAGSMTDGYWTIGYPGVLKNCEACHLPGANDFSKTDSKAVLTGDTGGTDARLFRYSATGNLNSADPLTAFAYSPWITFGTNYGSGFSYNAATGVATQAGAATLYESPLSTVCFACHDDDTTLKPNIGNTTAKAHMLANGGVIYGARGAGAAIPKSETCLTACHAPTAATNIKAVHAK